MFNQDKCVHLQLDHTNKLEFNYVLSPNREILKTITDEVSDLSVIVDNKLYWDQYIRNEINKANRIMSNKKNTCILRQHY